MKYGVRPNFLDYAKVITMFLVIWGHYIPYMNLEMGDNTLWKSVHIINIFHMPLFFMISGILFKKEDIRTLLKKEKTQLLLPYLYLSIIALFIGEILSFANHTFTTRKLLNNLLGILTGGDFGPAILQFSAPLWFVFALCIIKPSMILLLRRKTEWALLIIPIIIMHLGDILPFRLDSALVGLLFFYLGFKMKDIILKIEELSWQRLIGLFFCGMVMVFTTLVISDELSTSQVLSIQAVYFGKIPILYILGGLGGSISIMCFSQLLASYKIKVINTLSNGMIITLASQKLIFMLLAKVYTPKYSFIDCFLTSLIVLSITYLLILCTFKYCPALLGNRRNK